MGYGAAGVDLFTGLLDTPGSYVGQSGKLPFIKVTENGLEFLDPSAYATTKVFDGSTASPPTIYTTPLTKAPYQFADYETLGWYQGTFITVGDYLYIFGGGRPYGTAVYTNECYRYCYATGIWKRLANLPVNATSKYVAKAVGYSPSRNAIFWGVDYNNASLYEQILKYDIDANSWSVLAAMPAQSDVDEWWFVIPRTDDDYGYLHRSGSSFGGRFDKVDLTTGAWTALTAMPTNRSNIGFTINNEIYATRRDNLATYKFNGAVPGAWVDQAQASPIDGTNSGGFYDENDEEYWGHDWVANSQYYKYTPAGGWVSQCSQGRDCYPWEYGVRRAAAKDPEKTLYFVWGRSQGVGAPTEIIRGGCIHTFVSAGVWECLKQAFAIGDLLILYEQAGIPVNVELDGDPLFVGSGMDTVYIVKAGTYYFSLSKNFSMESVQIYRAEWG